MFPPRIFNAAVLGLSIVQASGFVPHPLLGQTGATSRASPAGGPVFGESPPAVTCLEFYSGIGGLRVSLEKAVDFATCVKSFEISSIANSVYERNFAGCRVTRRSIEHLSVEDVDGKADVWLLSPPCQPFCRIGKKMDEHDNRSLSFLHLLSLLETVKMPPSHLFLENVQGFDGSQAHRRLLETLTARGFNVEQYLLSPVQLGIPNTRLRFYCLASRQQVDGKGNVNAVEEALPSPSSLLQKDGGAAPLRPLSEYLDPSLTGEAVVPLLLSPKATSHANPSLRFDVVTLQSTQTTTFTKGYGKHAGRAGPVVLLTDDGKRRVSGESLGRFPSGLELGPEGREVRWFSDKEMLRLHGFPEEFDFPPRLTFRQRYALVGNSVNVEVVALLLKRMLCREQEGGQPAER
ncbi:unnamed protein product, partial [Hapterophycus canaliculatus]